MSFEKYLDEKKTKPTKNITCKLIINSAYRHTKLYLATLKPPPLWRNKLPKWLKKSVQY